MFCVRAFSCVHPDLFKDHCPRARLLTPCVIFQPPVRKKTKAEHPKLASELWDSLAHPTVPQGHGTSCSYLPAQGPSGFGRLVMVRHRLQGRPFAPKSYSETLPGEIGVIKNQRVQDCTLLSDPGSGDRPDRLVAEQCTVPKLPEKNIQEIACMFGLTLWPSSSSRKLLIEVQERSNNVQPHGRTWLKSRRNAREMYN